MSTVLNTEFCLVGNPDLYLPEHLRRPVVDAARASFAMDLILYDNVILYVRSFDALIDLVLWLGPSAFDALLDSGALSLVWGPASTAHLPAGSMVVPGGGHPGLNAYELYKDAAGLVMDVDRHIERSLTRRTSWGVPRRLDFTAKLHSVLSPIGINQQIVRDAIAETERDLQAPELINALGLSGRPSAALPSGDPEVPRLFRLNEVNIALRVAEEFPDADLHLETIAGLALPAKFSSALGRDVLAENVVAVVEARDLPDPTVFGKDRIAFTRLIDKHQSASALEFRKLLVEQDWTPEDRRKLLKECVKEWRTKGDTRTQRAIVTGLGVGTSLLTSGLNVPIQVATAVASDELGKRASEFVSRLIYGRGFTTFLDEELGRILADADPNRRDVLELRMKAPDSSP